MKLSRNTFSERSLHGRIAHDLGKKIVKGYYKPGDILPNETQLCKDLVVSRTAVREAFKVLTSKGLLESRPKIGTRVRAKYDWNLLDADMLAWGLTDPLDHDLVDSLIELAQVLFPQAAQLATLQATEKQHSEIEEAWVQLSEQPLMGQALIDAHLSLLLNILSSTQNALLSNLASLLINSFSELAEPNKWDSQLYNSLIEHYQELMSAIKNCQPQQTLSPTQAILTLHPKISFTQTKNRDLKKETLAEV